MGTRYTATLLEGGRIQLADGRQFRSPSGAAMAAADVVSYDGWYAWRTSDGTSLDDQRRRLAPVPEDLVAGAREAGEQEGACMRPSTIDRA